MLLEFIIFPVTALLAFFLLLYLAVAVYWDRRNAKAAEELVRALSWADREKLRAYEEYREVLDAASENVGCSGKDH